MPVPVLLTAKRSLFARYLQDTTLPPSFGPPHQLDFSGSDFSRATFDFFEPSFGRVGITRTVQALYQLQRQTRSFGCWQFQQFEEDRFSPWHSLNIPASMHRGDCYCPIDP